MERTISQQTLMPEQLISPEKSLHVVSSTYEALRLERSAASGGVALEFKNAEGNISKIALGSDDSIIFTTPSVTDGSAFRILDRDDESSSFASYCQIG